jgi:superoxide dismutase
MLDHAAKRAGYIEIFFRNINWKLLEGRLLKPETASRKPVDSHRPRII